MVESARRARDCGRDLYGIHPDGNLDAEEERRLCERSDALVFVHPFHWYAAPWLMKRWIATTCSPAAGPAAVVGVPSTVTVPSPLLLHGTVTLQDVVSGLDLVQTVRLEFKEPGTGTNFATADVDLGPAMEFTVASPRVAPYDVTLKLTHWLRRRVAENPSSSAAPLVLRLVNGDVTGDNSVNISDFLFLRAAFGSTPASPNWNAMADLNMDGSVGIADFLTLRRNLGQTGD